MSKHIKVQLTPEGIERAIALLESYKRDLNKKVQQLVSRMVGEGKAYAINNISHIDTGLTIGSVVGVRNGNKGVILAGGNAIWIEFGTGVLLNGADNVHDRKLLGINTWGTFTQDGSGVSKGSGANGWYYYNEERQQVEHTYGIPMNPFMYYTAKMLRERYAEYAKEIFK